MSTCTKCGATYPNSVRFCTADGTVLEEDAPAETNLVGKVLAGKYRLDAYLSKGGMGAVFRATHLMLEKQVALKVIKPELVGSSEFVRRFQREARAATSLNHPNIVGVYDLGQTEDGTLYIAMEFVDGASLKDVIRKSGPMDPVRIARIMRQILGALALAHRHHVVHRDLKPQNIMLMVDRGGNEVAKLLDFGIAKTFDDRTQLTATGFAIGTPQYMAPEQAAGTEVDGRSDLYSLGIILYEMLVAEVPFNDPSTPAILVKHLTEVPIRPSQRRTDIAVHRGLEDVAVRCLEKDPAKRYQTAEQVSEALAAVVSLDAQAGSASEAGMLPMGSPDIAVGTTRTAVPAAALVDASLAPTMTAGAAARSSAPPTILDPAPSVAASTHVTGPTAAAPPPAAPAATVGAAAAAPAREPAPPPASAARQTPAPVVKGGRNLLALGIGALAIVALAGMGFAIQQFVGRSEPESASALPANAPPTAPAQASADTSGAANAATGAPAPGTSAEHAKPADTTSTPPPSAANANASRDAAATAPTEPSSSATPAGPGAQPPSRASADVSSSAGRVTRQPVTPTAHDAGRTANTAANRAAAAAAAAAVPVAESPQPAVPQLPENPTVLLRCEGAVEICGAVRDAFNSALERDKMPLTTSAPRADIYIVVNAAAVDGQVQQQFGTTFVVRNYTISVDLEAPKMEMAPGAPPSRTFSADLRVGRERVVENARLVAIDTVQKIREFWTKRRAISF